MICTLADGSKIECDDQPFAEGGEGLLYWDKAGQYVVKLYKTVEPQREAALQKIISPQYNIVQSEPYWDSLFAWPKMIVKQPQLGLLMARASQGSLELQWFLGAKQRQVVAKKHGAAKLGQWSNYLTLAIKMAQTVRRMHFRGLCHSDLSFRNFLVDPATDSLMLIDCDGLVVPDFLPPQVLGTSKCMAPELAAQLTSPHVKASPSASTDLHALATLIYWLLLLRHPLLGPKIHDSDPALDEALSLGEQALFIEHPTDTSNRPADLKIRYQDVFTPAVAKLIEAAFIEGLHQPAKRPAAAYWERELGRMKDSLVMCDNPKCPFGAFVFSFKQPLRCHCGTIVTRYAKLPLFYFYKPWSGQPGMYQGERGYVWVGLPDRTLQLWHVDPTQPPSPGLNTVIAAARLKYQHKQKTWLLQNLALPNLLYFPPYGSPQSIRIQQEVPLVDGARLLFNPPHGRAAYIQFVS